MAYPKVLELNVQKARGTYYPELLDDSLYVVEEKYDGVRALLHVTDTGEFEVTTTKTSVRTERLQRRTAQCEHLYPKRVRGAVLDVELLPSPKALTAARRGGKATSDVVGALLRCAPEESARRQAAEGYIQAVAFDCLFYKGQDVRGKTLRERSVMVHELVTAWDLPSVSMARRWSNAASKRAAFGQVTARGGEGIVIKRLDATYGNEGAWVKRKAVWTADLVILGFEEAKPESVKKGATEATPTKIAGMVGAIIGGQYTSEGLVRVATVGGINEELRAKLTEAPGAHVGRVIEVKHNGRQPTGRFRHPRFLRFRDDKRPADCMHRKSEV